MRNKRIIILIILSVLNIGGLFSMTNQPDPPIDGNVSDVIDYINSTNKIIKTDELLNLSKIKKMEEAKGFSRKTFKLDGKINFKDIFKYYGIDLSLDLENSIKNTIETHEFNPYRYLAEEYSFKPEIITSIKPAGFYIYQTLTDEVIAYSSIDATNDFSLVKRIKAAVEPAFKNNLEIMRISEELANEVVNKSTKHFNNVVKKINYSRYNIIFEKKWNENFKANPQKPLFYPGVFDVKVYNRGKSENNNSTLIIDASSPYTIYNYKKIDGEPKYLKINDQSRIEVGKGDILLFTNKSIGGKRFPVCFFYLIDIKDDSSAHVNLFIASKKFNSLATRDKIKMIFNDGDLKLGKR